jgi:hypothetical protein
MSEPWEMPPCFCGSGVPESLLFMWVPSMGGQVCIPGCPWCRDAIFANYPQDLQFSNITEMADTSGPRPTTGR